VVAPSYTRQDVTPAYNRRALEALREKWYAIRLAEFIEAMRRGRIEEGWTYRKLGFSPTFCLFVLVAAVVLLIGDVLVWPHIFK